MGKTHTMLRVGSSCRDLFPKDPERLPEGQIFLVESLIPTPETKEELP